MGQHKTNPNVQLAKDGMLPEKEPRMGKREFERYMQGKVADYVLRKVALAEINAEREACYEWRETNEEAGLGLCCGLIFCGPEQRIDYHQIVKCVDCPHYLDPLI